MVHPEAKLAIPIAREVPTLTGGNGSHSSDPRATGLFPGGKPHVAIELHMGSRSMIAEFERDIRDGIIASDVTEGTQFDALKAIKKELDRISSSYSTPGGQKLARSLHPQGLTYPVRDPITKTIGIKVKLNLFSAIMFGVNLAEKLGKNPSSAVIQNLLETVAHELVHAKVLVLTAVATAVPIQLPFSNDHNNESFKAEAKRVRDEGMKEPEMFPAMPKECKGVVPK